MKTNIHTILFTGTQGNKNGKKHYSNFWSILTLFFLSISFSTPSLGHRGQTDEIDNCRIKVGFEKIHFTAYTPEFSGAQGYCQEIPNLGVTNLVFDFEGKKLRNISLEFEVTKEPEGTRVFYQPAQKIKTGTVNASIDFSKYGAGDYLAHVTIVYKGEKLDTHLPFSVGVGGTKTPWGRYFIFLIIVLLIVFFVKLNRINKINEQSSEPAESE